MVAFQAGLLVSVFIFALYRFLSEQGSVLAIYMALWSIFHLCEYYVTQKYLPRTATEWLFLLFGARGAGNLFMVHIGSILEYALTQKYWRYHGYVLVGVPLALSGIVVRALAIQHCGNSFSHYIESERPQKLVTNGIYAWCRHPSYLGFILYVMGMQVLFGNIFIYVMSMVILFRFFSERIELEEIVLVNNLYGEAYEKYSEKVSALVPFLY